MKAPQEFIDLLNKAVAREIQVSAQYIIQHTKMEKLLRKVIKENYLLETTTYDEFGKILKDFSIQEMKHLGTIMERIYILGGEATTKPDPITIGNSMKEFAQLGLKAEEEALDLYREIIRESKKYGDRTTWQIFSRIYSEEEEHLLKFQEYVDIEDEPDLGETPESDWRAIFTPEYISMLNKAVASEISAIIQYTTQHEKADGLERLRKKEAHLEVVSGKNKASVVSDLLKETFLVEMKHLEKIAERIHEIDKDTKADVDPMPEIGQTAEDFIKLDREAENYAIKLYRKIIEEAARIGDIKTKTIFEDIIQDEESHYWNFDDYVP
jgi:bacterioferritin